MTNLTAAELDAIEARWASVGRRVPGGPDRASEAIPDPRPDIAALLTALREARALVEALVDTDPPLIELEHWDKPLTEWACQRCKATIRKEWVNAHCVVVHKDGLQHAPDCAWENARKALAAWNAAPHDQLPE